MTGFPVGSQKKIRKKNTEEYVLNEGETIVFYTDGIIEATGKTSEQYGYDRFKNSISQMGQEKKKLFLIRWVQKQSNNLILRVFTIVSSLKVFQKHKC